MRLTRHLGAQFKSTFLGHETLFGLKDADEYYSEILGVYRCVDLSKQCTVKNRYLFFQMKNGKLFALS